MSRSTVVLLAIAATFTVVVAAAAVVAAVMGGEDHFAEGTPERAVQDYIKAVEDNDATKAFGFLAPALLTRCGEPPREVITRRGRVAVRATLDRTVERDGAASVFVRLAETYGNAPLGIGDPAQELVFELAQVDGSWRFTEMPWPLYCAFPKGATPAAPAPPVPAEGAR